jgi:hypothetical protein
MARNADVVVDREAPVHQVGNNWYSDLDLSELSDAELDALGIDPSSIEREDPEEDEEKEEDEEEETLEEEEEKEEEDDEEEESTEEDEEEEVEEDKDKDIRIPKARFDEAVQKERQKAQEAEQRTKFLEEQINRLLEMQTTGKAVEEKVEEVAVDIDALEAQYAEKLLEGETDEAIKIRRQINAEYQKLVNNAIKSAKEEARAESKSLSETEKFNLVKEDSFNKYPFLSNESDTFDQELVAEINALAAGYKQTLELSPADALKKAVNKLAPPYKKQLEGKKTATKQATDRKQEKAKRVAKEPVRSKGSSVKNISPDELDWENMSEKEFDHLYKTNRKVVDAYLKGSHLK